LLRILRSFPGCDVPSPIVTAAVARSNALVFPPSGGSLEHLRSNPENHGSWFYFPKARTLVDNSGVVQLFGARNHRMAQDFAALVGGVDADAIMAMPRDELLLIEGGRPRYARKMRYFEEELCAGLYDGAQTHGAR
jgi:hypothetical protein